MACFHPVPAFQPGPGKPAVLWPPIGQETMHVPCAKCDGCKVARAQEWALRAVHEARLHAQNVFVTLTYDDDHLPSDQQLHPGHLDVFHRDVRNALRPGTALRAALVGDRLRYLSCGEYGDRTQRPHYHALLFGIGFRDLKRYNARLWESPALNEIWGRGRCTVGEVTAASAAYVASYTMKKLGRTHADADGVVMQAPFLRCSNRPGIGASHAMRYADDMRHGYAVNPDGERRPIPRYYRRVLHKHALSTAAEAEVNQGQYLARHAKQLRAASAPERLHAAERILQVKRDLRSRRTF